jgi:hypothetical protein
METRNVEVELLKAGKPNETIFILGATGCGKTTLIANIARNRQRAIIFDCKEDYPQEFFPGSVLCKNPGELANALNVGATKIIIPLYSGDETLFDKCCDVIYRWHVAQGGKFETYFVHDELNAITEHGQVSEEFRNVAQRGRSVGIKKVFAAQWFGNLPTWLRDSFTEIYTFQHTDETGLDRLERFGFDAEQVRNLAPYSCLHRKGSTIELVTLTPAKGTTQKTE